MVNREKRRKCVKRNEGAWLATRKKNIFWGPGAIRNHKFAI